MAKKKELKKEVEAKEESKLMFDDIKEKCLKYIKENKENIIKATVSVIVLVLVVTLGMAAIDVIIENSTGNIKYSLVYKRENGEIALLKPEDDSGKKSIILSKTDGTGYTTYANKTNRYILMKKDTDLHIYDVKKDESIKIADNTSTYFFSDNDDYVLIQDTDNDMYSYNHKEAKKILDSGITGIRDYGKKGVIYEKNKKLYYISYNPEKEDKVELVKGVDIAEFSKNEKYVLYTNSNKALYRYDIKKKKHKKIASDVETFYCDSESCDTLYYTVLASDYSINYYNGKKTEKIVGELRNIEYINTDEKSVIYTRIIDGEEVLCFKKGTANEIKLSDNFTHLGGIKLVGDEIYYINDKNELNYAKVTGLSNGKAKVIDKEVESVLYDFNDGIYYFKNSDDDKQESTFYIAKNGKKIKVADDIYQESIKVSNDGNKIFYIKDRQDYQGELYMFDGKTSRKISEKVHTFLYIRDDLVYYLKDFDVEKRYGTLYKYTNKNTKIEEKVSELSSTPNAYIVK